MISKMLIAICVLLFTVLPLSYADDWRSGVKMADDLQSVAVESQTKKLPVMFFFAGKYCEYCEMLEEDHLSGMARSSEYKEKVIIRKVVIDSYDNIRDFNGRKVSSEEFSERFSIKITPTLVLVDHEGNQLAKKIFGYNRSDFFGLTLDEAIDEARKRIN